MPRNNEYGRYPVDRTTIDARRSEKSNAEDKAIIKDAWDKLKSGKSDLKMFLMRLGQRKIVTARVAEMVIAISHRPEGGKMSEEKFVYSGAADPQFPQYPSMYMDAMQLNHSKVTLVHRIEISTGDSREEIYKVLGWKAKGQHGHRTYALMGGQPNNRILDRNYPQKRFTLNTWLRSLPMDAIVESASEERKSPSEWRNDKNLTVEEMVKVSWHAKPQKQPSVLSRDYYNADHPTRGEARATRIEIASYGKADVWPGYRSFRIVKGKRVVRDDGRVESEDEE